MSNILFLTSTYLPSPGANGINSHAIIKDLIENGHNVIVISTKNDSNELDYEIIEDIKIHRITPSSFTEKKKSIESLDVGLSKKLRIGNLLLLRKLKIILNMYKFPNFDEKQNLKTYQLVKNLIDKYKVTSIVSIYKPYSNIHAIKKIKEEFPNINCGVYFLDLLDSMVRPNILPENYYNNLINNENLNTLQKVDYILTPISSKKYYSQKIFEQYYSKIEYIDFPTLKIDKDINANENIVSMSNKKQTFTYAGTLDLNYRNPEFFLKAFSEYNKKHNYNQLHILGKNNCELLFNKYNKEIPLTNHGFSSQDKVKEYNIKADFLINISNSMENTVPSKIFELFSTGKPIINFVQNKNDFSLMYFDLYPCCFNFYNWKDFDAQIDMMSKFIETNINTIVDFKVIEKLFYMNTPKYTSDKIVKRIK